MDLKGFVKLSLADSHRFATMLINDIKDRPVQYPTPNGGNHPLWVLGHLAFSESFILDECLLGKSVRFPELSALFNSQTNPVADVSKYPPMLELFSKWELIRAALVAHLDSLTEADFDKPSAIGNKYGPPFATVGACFAVLISHPVFHAGQVADARRAAGKAPLFA